MDHNAGMDTKLYKASKSGDAKLLDKVLQGTVDVFDEVTPAGDTALHTAAFYGHAYLATKLIQLASENPEAGMQFLKAQNRDGNTALHAAAEGGWIKIVKVLVEKVRDLACVKNKGGETALFKASENGHVGVVEFLLDCTPESEEADKRADGQTPLHVAVVKLHRGVVDKLLVRRPALVHKADGFQRTALHILALAPLAIGSWSTSTRANIGLIGKKLLDKKISLMYEKDDNGQSALHLGAKVGNAPLVEVILMYGTDCTVISDKNGQTALHLAVENGSQIYERVGTDLKYIISSLAQRRLINCSDESGQTALDIAIQKVKEDKRLFLGMTTYLRSHGASVKKFETETREDSASSTPQKSNRGIDMMSTNAVLIATVAFAAAFTLPGDIDTKGKHPFPLLLNDFVFKLFVISDSVAFCSSVGSTVLFYYARVRNQKDRVLSTICYGGVWVSLTSIALAFGAAIHLLVAHKCMWLAVAVWIMVGCLPIGVRLMSVLGKVHLFTEATQFMVEFVRPLVVFILPIGLYFMSRFLLCCYPWISGSIVTLGCLSLAWRKRHVLMWYWAKKKLGRIFRCSFVVLFVSSVLVYLFGPYICSI